MCNLAPFQRECEFDDFQHDLICCNANHLHEAIYRLLKTSPVVGKFIPEYQCPAFMPKEGVRNE